MNIQGTHELIESRVAELTHIARQPVVFLQWKFQYGCHPICYSAFCTEQVDGIADFTGAKAADLFLVLRHYRPLYSTVSSMLSTCKFTQPNYTRRDRLMPHPLDLPARTVNVIVANEGLYSSVKKSRCLFCRCFTVLIYAVIFLVILCAEKRV